MPAWLVKEEPSKYAWETFVSDRRTCWDKVRNFQARNNLRAMRKGDEVVFYHSVTTKAAMGVCAVVAEAYPDPSASDGDWSAVDLAVVESFAAPVTLAAIKADPLLAECALVKQSRLSVMPLTAAQLKRFRRLGAGR